MSVRQIVIACVAAAGMMVPLGANAQSLRESVALTLKSNPRLGQAIENREAIEFELRQARGLFMPRVDSEFSVGARRLERPTQPGLRNERNFAPAEAGVVATLKLFDGFGREAEVERQAARVDGASLRVMERAEFLALEVAREYLDVLLQQRLVGIAEQHVGFLSDVFGRIRTSAANGSLTDADVRQGEERVLSARARLIEARQELSAARIRLAQIVGIQVNRMSAPPTLAGRLPKSVDAGVGLAVRNNPRIKIATADIDAAHALVRAARARMAPEIFLEGRARVGHDVDGVAGRTNDVQGRAVMRWNLYNGGIDEANIQEQTRRTAEAQFIRDQVLREVRETVQLSMDRRSRQIELAGMLSRQIQAGNRVAQSYSEQFAVGRRSLLDLLDAQNTRYNASVLAETARTSVQFAEYRILAATGQLVGALGLQAPQQAQAVARDDARVPPTISADQLPRRSPPAPGQRPWLPSGAIQ